MVNLRGYAERINEQIRPTSFPFAVKLLKEEKDIPEGAQRPKRDFGTCLSVCQGFSLSRKYGMSVALLKEDMWCPEPVIGYGLAEPPTYFLNGHNRYPEGVESLQAGANWARAFPRLKYGKYVGIVSAPLMNANFEPDLVIVYCNSAQLLRFLLAIAYKDGSDVKSILSGHAACVYSVVPSMETGKCHVAVPCRGDRCRAGTQDDEMIFTVPRKSLDDLVLGLEKGGTGTIPTRFSMTAEYKLPKNYAKLAKLMGIKKASTQIQNKEIPPYEQ